MTGTDWRKCAFDIAICNIKKRSRRRAELYASRSSALDRPRLEQTGESAEGAEAAALDPARRLWSMSKVDASATELGG